MQPISLLPPKLQPHLLNGTIDAEKKNAEKEISEFLGNLPYKQSPLQRTQNQFTVIKPGVFGHAKLPNWIIKIGADSRDPFAVEQNLYRVRKGQRIEAAIQKHGLQHFIVPQEHVYCYSQQSTKPEFWVVSKKEDLAKNPITEQSLSREQGREGALLCFKAHLPDVGAHNMGLNKQGKIVLFDVEPANRSFYKSLDTFFYRCCMPGIKSYMKYMYAISDSEKFALLTKDITGIRQVQDQAYDEQKSQLIKQMALPLIFSVGILIAGLSISSPVWAAVGFIATLLAQLNLATRACMLGAILHANYYWRSEKGRQELRSQIGIVKPN